MKTILSVKNLKKYFSVKNSWGNDVALVKALDGVDLEIESVKHLVSLVKAAVGRLHLCVLYSDLLNPHQVQ